MDDRLENVVVQSLNSSAQISAVAFLGKDETAQRISAISGKGCGSSDCSCYGDYGDDGPTCMCYGDSGGNGEPN